MTPTNPISYPHVRDATFADGVGPTVHDSWLNGTQDALLYLYGALQGRSYTFEVDEFDRATYGAAQFGSLRIQTNTNAPGTMATGLLTPANAGEHGIWGATANTAAAYNFDAVGGYSDIALLDCLFSARVRIVNRGRLDVIPRGLRIGIVGAATDWISFACGSDQPNWYCTINGVTADSGIALTDGVWYDLQGARQNATAILYINGVQVLTGALNVSIADARRRVQSVSPAANVADGFHIDYFKVGYQR